MPQLNLRRAVDSLANSRGRSAWHVLFGLGLTAAAVAASAVLARLSAPAETLPETYSDYEDPAAAAAPKAAAPKPLFAMLWPPLFLALTLSGLRIWNAPKSPARTQALTLWTFVQGLNAFWMAAGPKRLGGALATATAALGTAGAYVWRARRVDAPAAEMVAPYVGWIGFANVLSEEFRRKGDPKPTLH